jgi:hypothetical protein
MKGMSAGEAKNAVMLIVYAVREESVLSEKHDVHFRRVGMAGYTATNRP